MSDYMNTVVLILTIITATTGTIFWVDNRIDEKTNLAKTELSQQAEFHFLELSIKIDESILANYENLEVLAPAQQREYNLLVDEITRLTERRQELIGIDQ
jgi:hypothetical protein